MRYFRRNCCRKARLKRGTSFDFSRGKLGFEQLESRRMMAAFDVLVFSKTAGFRHDSIDEGVAAIEALGAEHNFTVTRTEDAALFTAGNLAPYEAVVFLNTTGDVLDAAQQTAFEGYIRAGGGFVGVHSAADTEYGWTWYGQLMGAYFAGHPAIQQATIKVADHAHASTADLPDRWVRIDELYNYATNPRGNVHVLATLDESTYTGGTMGFDHPISWYHNFDGGRAWYTGLGHTESSYVELLFLDHLLGGIEYAAGQPHNVPTLPGDYNRNDVVDAADYVLWRNSLGSSVTPFSGADGDGSGTIDQNDNAVWRSHFGQTLPTPAAGSADVGVESVVGEYAELAGVAARQPEPELPVMAFPARDASPKRMGPVQAEAPASAADRAWPRNRDNALIVRLDSLIHDRRHDEGGVDSFADVTFGDVAAEDEFALCDEDFESIATGVWREHLGG